MELTFFKHPGWQPRIRPAAPRREWMENTAERFAYRCLPLAIANAHGWEVGSPCGFSARWLGGEGVDRVEIRPDAGADPAHLPVSLFGQGTVTFHVEALIRTSPGWNLWVGGSPNAAKDGISPLGGVIETDWSPYSFTMNWRFTRPDHWVRWEEDEPFCFLFPVQRGVVDAITPVFRSMEDAPDLRDAFDSWSASRNAFQAWVEETKPAAPADRWQKLYYRGVNPDGSRGVPDHQSKLHVAVPTGDAGTCPVVGAPGGVRHQPPSDTAAPLSAAPLPTTPAAPPPVDHGRALQQREWLLQVAEEMRALSAATAGIACVGDLSAAEFLDHFYAPGRPALIVDALADWPAPMRWTPDYLADAVGDAPVTVTGGEGGTLPFRRFVALANDGTGRDLQLVSTDGCTGALAPLGDDLRTLDRFLAPNPGTLWIGSAGVLTPLHHGLVNSLVMQLAGRRRMVLLPPAATGRLYNRHGVFSAVRDITDPEQVTRHPLAADAQAFEVVLEPGQALFIPIGWWQQARTETFGATAIHTHFLWPNDGHLSYPHA